jgi:hypothetical protein
VTLFCLIIRYILSHSLNASSTPDVASDLRRLLSYDTFLVDIGDLLVLVLHS